MVIDYKRMAINAFLIGRSCNGPKNSGYKHSDLIERALYGNEDWFKLRKIFT